jgi:hypothetical protein
MPWPPRRTARASARSPPSWVDRCPRCAAGCAQWLYQRAVERCAQIDRELLVRPAPYKTLLGHGLNLLAGAALRYRDRLGLTDPPWALIGFFAHGRLLAQPLIS